MKNFNCSGPKLFIIAAFTMLMASCIKNDNFVIGDAKVRIFNNVLSDTSQNIFFNGILFNSTSQPALISSSNSPYLIVVADQEYTIDTRNSITGNTNASVKGTFGIGRNYSIYYTQADTLKGPRKMIIYEDTVRQNLRNAQVMFINLGSTLKSTVNIKNRGGTISKMLNYGEKSDYYPITTLNKDATFEFKLADSTTIDTLSYTNFVKGKVYTIIVEGSKNGKLKERLVANN